MGTLVGTLATKVCSHCVFCFGTASSSSTAGITSCSPDVISTEHTVPPKNLCMVELHVQRTDFPVRKLWAKSCSVWPQHSNQCSDFMHQVLTFVLPSCSFHSCRTDPDVILLISRNLFILWRRRIILLRGKSLCLDCMASKELFATGQKTRSA